jgi:hypothetical protein
MKRPQFTVRGMLLLVALVACALGAHRTLVWYSLDISGIQDKPFPREFFFAMWMFVPTGLGLGLGIATRHACLGAFLGLAVGFIAVLAMLYSMHY